MKNEVEVEVEKREKNIEYRKEIFLVMMGSLKSKRKGD